MSTERVIGVILLTAAITFLLRSLPFLIFRGERKMWEMILQEMESLNVLRYLWSQEVTSGNIIHF